MSQFATLVTGERRCRSSKNFHRADRNGRLYLCACMPAMRISQQIKHPTFSRNSRR